MVEMKLTALVALVVYVVWQAIGMGIQLVGMARKPSTFWTW